MRVIDCVGNIQIDVGGKSPNSCQLTATHGMNDGEVIIWKQDWEEIKKKIDKMFEITMSERKK